MHLGDVLLSVKKLNILKTELFEFYFTLLRKLRYLDFLNDILTCFSGAYRDHLFLYKSENVWIAD